MTNYTAPPDQTGLVLNGGDTLHVEVNGLAYGTLINGGTEYVGGGISIGTTINGGGQEFVDDGTSSGTIINVGGIQYDQGGASIDTMINEGGQEFVQNGPLEPSTATDTTIDGAGAFQLVAGGTSIATTIKAGGTELVYNGGTANGTIIQDGGIEHVQNSGTASTAIFAGSNSVLELDTPSGLTGTITDWQVGDKIDFLNTIVTSVNETGGMLTVTYGNKQTMSYSLAGQQANTEFQLQPDGNGGTDLSLKVKDITSSSSAHLLSLAGGGIKAMTADAGLFAGLLKYFGSEGEPTTIGNLLSKESAVSANSGSSWFTDLLAYSKSFDNSLQNYTAFFSQSGYMGQLETAYYNFAKVSNINPLIDEVLKSIGDLAGINLEQIYGLLANSSTNWNNFLSQVIFEPYNSAQLLQSVNFHLDQPLRTDALPSQSLIYESSISSNDAAINNYSLLFNETVSTITNAGVDTSGNTYIFIPAVITSLGSATDASAPALPSISTGSLDVTYSTYNTGSPSATKVLPNFNFDGLSAFLAASASSAAVSAVASGGVYDTGGVADYTNGLPKFLLSALLNKVQDVSPLVQVNNANGTSIASDPHSVTQGTSLLRLADGGYIDNTSVTSGLTYLQANNDISNFAVTALTYSGGSDQNLAKINPGYNNIGEQAEVLFTGSNQNQTVSIVNLSHPSAAVFDATQTTGLDQPIWEYIGSDGFKLDYFQLGVTTAPNDMGIAAGAQGTLNLWVVTTTAEALPSLDQKTWSQYSDLYNQMISALQSLNNGHIGADLLAHSLGLSSDLGLQIDATTIHNANLGVLRVNDSDADAAAVAASINGGQLKFSDYVTQLISQAQSATVPALVTDDFFFGKTPGSAGLDFLTNFATTIQTPAGGGFSVVNTFVNLAATDAINPSSSFDAVFGVGSGASEQTFFNNVYNQLFGNAPSQAAIDNYFHTQTFNLPNGMTIVGSSFDFYREYVRESLPTAQQTAANLENGARGCVVGTLLYFAEVTPSTQYAQATTHFFQDAAVETPAYQVSLIGTYLASSTPHL